ncbi:MAG: SMC-Scp complex subunit ScpB [Candidatus Hatepunaea meridiana]|nr:SMC-Scp complex subunit ScpB [Candidatus Hatepunaea meridiana]
MSNVDINLIEALIFAAPEPIEVERLIEIIGNVECDDIISSIDELNRQYEDTDRSFSIIRGGGGYRFATKPQFSKWVKKLVIGSGRIRLSRAALETVSLIAYRQPISRSAIETVRGVDAGGVLKMLLERNLIRVKGYGSGPGRPLLYVTTPNFLCHFGIDSLDDLPEPEEMANLNQSEIFNTNETNRLV